MCTSCGRCGKITANVSWAMWAWHHKYFQSRRNVAFPMLLAGCRHLFPKAHMHWWCCLPFLDADLALQMRMWHCLCVKVFADVASVWSTMFAWCTLAADDVVYRWPMSLLLSICIYSMIVACMPWYMSHAVGQLSWLWTTRNSWFRVTDSY